MNRDECDGKLRHLPPIPHHCGAVVGMVSLAIGAHAALNMRALDAAKAVATEQDDAARRPLAARAGDRQRPLPRRQRAADPADQRRPRADRGAAPRRF